MFTKDFDEGKKNILRLLEVLPKKQSGLFLHHVKNTLKKRAAILRLTKRHETPFYLFDAGELRKSAQDYRQTFSKYLPGSKHFYAVKCNYYSGLLRELTKLGFGLDVSSTRELKLALAAGAKEILFSGPGKTEKDLTEALKHRSKVIINIDSFGELERLGKLTNKTKQTVRVGVRFFSSYHGAWSKFGISMTELKSFWKRAASFKYIQLCGTQFHTSSNPTPIRHVQIIQVFGEYLKKNFGTRELTQLKFIDIGGGFFPDSIDGIYPWSYSNTYPWMLNAGHFLKTANTYFGKTTEFKDRYYPIRASSIETYARDISHALKTSLPKGLNCQFFTEPGRVLATPSMHIVLRIVDVKGKHGITDGGFNMQGWEFGQFFYTPILNLTHPSQKEVEHSLWGSLCTPRDFWGYYCYAAKMAANDVIVIPNQGAYRYTLAQEFIRPIPPVYAL